MQSQILLRPICALFTLVLVNGYGHAEIFMDFQRGAVRAASAPNGQISEKVDESLFSQFSNEALVTGSFGLAKVQGTYSFFPTLRHVLVEGTTTGSISKISASPEASANLRFGVTIIDETVPFTLTGSLDASSGCVVNFRISKDDTFFRFNSFFDSTQIDINEVLEPGVYVFEFDQKITPGISTAADMQLSFKAEIGSPSCDLTWNVSDGDMGDAGSWNPGRVPEDSGDGCDNLLLLRSGEYTVPFPTLEVNSLRVENGVPTLLGQILTLSGRQDHDALSISEGASVTLAGGKIALPFGDRIAIGSGASSNALGRLAVEGTSQILQEPQGVMEVGVNQPGELRVSGEGSVSVGELSVGRGTAGSVHVLGATSETKRATLAVANDAVIGDDASGELLVEAGGIFGTFGNLFVGLSAPGSVTIGGEDVSGLGVQSTVTVNQAIVGGNQSSVARVTVLQGGLFQANGVSVGAGLGDGELILIGDNDDTVQDAKARIGGNMRIGGANDGLLRLENSAVLEMGQANENHSLRVASDGPGSGSVTLSSDDASPDLVAPLLDIEGDLDIGLTGIGVLSVNRGVVSVSESILLNRGSITLVAKNDPTIKTTLLTDGSSFVVGPGDGSDTTINIEAGAQFITRQSLSFSNGRIALSGALPDQVVAPNAPLVDSASLLKVLANLEIGVASPPDPGDARLRIQNGAIVDAGDILIRSGEVVVSTASDSTRPSALQSFATVTVGNAPSLGDRIATLSVLGESFVEAPQGFIIRSSGRVTHTRGAAFPRPRVESGGRIRMIRGTGGNKAIATAVYNGGLALEQGTVLAIDADDATEPHIVVNGDADLLGDLEVTFPDESGLQPGATFNLIRITGARNGGFNSVRFPTRSAAFRGNLRFENGVLVLDVIDPGSPIDAGVPNDVNGDRKVNAIDVQLVVNAVLGVALHPSFAPDVNTDNWVNAIDVQLVVNTALGV